MLKKVQFIISYHPPIFEAFKQLTTNNVKQRIIIKCIENGIAVYSPHTALDVVTGGVNDWIADSIGEGIRKAIKPSELSSSMNKIILYFSPQEVDIFKDLSNLGAHAFFISPSSLGESKVELVVPKHRITEVFEIVKKIKLNNKFTWETFPLDPEPNTNVGVGRIVILNEAVKLSVLIERVKKLTGLQYLKVAISGKDIIKKVAICAGSGGSILKGVRADAFITGEMAHHDLLAATAQGTSVILCDHSNSERGYLQILKNKLDTIFQGAVNVHLSTTDVDPLVIV